MMSGTPWDRTASAGCKKFSAGSDGADNISGGRATNNKAGNRYRNRQLACNNKARRKGSNCTDNNRTGSKPGIRKSRPGIRTRCRLKRPRSIRVSPPR